MVEEGIYIHAKRWDDVVMDFCSFVRNICNMYVYIKI